ncbi:M36 family metallopeptidase [Pseudomonadota bacterium]
MKSNLVRSLVFSVLVTALCISTVAQAQNETRIFRGTNGVALTGPSARSHAEIIDSFLQSKGSDVTGLVIVGEQEGQNQVVHYRLQQEIDGLRIQGSESKASVDGQGRVLVAIDNTVPNRGLLRRTNISDDQAYDIAADYLYGNDQPDMHRTSVERVAIPGRGGELSEGFWVEVWTARTNQLNYILVGRTGEVLLNENRTNNDAYRVFTDNPIDTPQALIAGPGTTGNDESPSGWLNSGNHRDIDIAGNNVNAYLDASNSNSADSGGNTVSDGNFTTTINLGAQPTTAQNRAVAVQNLFYLNNVIHDKLYKHGFNEAAGNFQENNFGNGGSGSDSVNAEAQDGSGTNNANFSTPNDGSNPRMQMYLFDGLGDHKVVAGGITYLAMGAEFGPALNATGVSGQVVVANDGSGTTSDGCQSFSNALGKIAFIDRGTCDFVTKVKNAQNGGAIGAIIANNAGDDIITMGGTDGTINIGSVFVGQTDGAAIAGASSAIIASNPNVLMVDGDLDSDIVYHEYGHGLTWRMIGSMSGPMSGAIGEGMGDVLSFMMNGRPTVGQYATGSTAGIRSESYEGYSRTYGDFSGAEVHDDGEIYAAAVWKVRSIFIHNGVPLDNLWDYLVDGMNYTPAGPDMDDMRDGILQSAANFNRGDECLIWEGFAAYGIGEGASTRKRGPKYTVTESFAVPASCDSGGNNPPTAKFTSSCSDRSCSFDGGSSSDDSGIASYSWNFGDNTNGSGALISHTYDADGTYTVMLTVTDGGGLSNFVSHPVTVAGPVSGGFTLTAVGRKVKGVNTIDLTWSGATSTNVDIKRGGVQFINTPNNGAYTDSTGDRGGHVYTYQVCEEGSSTCSNTVQVVF